MNDKDPIKPARITNTLLLLFNSGSIIFDAKYVIVQKRNSIVNALDTTLRKFIAIAMFSGTPNANIEKNLPSKR